jgi:AcrR family transcriptional regulator
VCTSEFIQDSHTGNSNPKLVRGLHDKAVTIGFAVRMTDIQTDPKLLVRASLEALLAKSAGRLDAAARVERLKAAALLECASKGYGNLTVAAIAERAQISTATIYAEYRDRDALLVSAMELLLGIVAGDVIEVPDVADPVERVTQLLVAHGLVYAEPLATWFFRLHVTLAWSGAGHLHRVGRSVFEGIDAFWASLLQQMVDEGVLEPLDLRLAVPMLLGPVERCTIISRLACGDDETGRPTLEAVARHAAEGLFAVYRRRPAAERPPLVPDCAPSLAPLDFAPSNPVALLAALRSDQNPRLTPQERKARILLAAVIECQERGYNAASMTEVAARAGVSIATVYKHFHDKASLFSAALTEAGGSRMTAAGSADNGALTQSVLAASLLDEARTMADPDWVWIPNIVMASELSGTDAIVGFARRYRAWSEARWASRLAALAGAGVRADNEPGSAEIALLVNQLLGPMERTGVLALILFGREGVDTGLLADLSAASVGFLLARTASVTGADRSGSAAACA